MPLNNATRENPQSVDEYFARLPSSECVDHCEQLVDGYYTEAVRSGRLALYRTAFYDYYEGFLVKGQLYRKGAQGEQTGVVVNNYHNFIKHRVNKVCEQKLAYEPQTVDGSHQSLDQIRLAKGLLDLYSERPDIDLAGKMRQATQYSQMFMESWTFALWDESLGKPVALDTESNTLVPEGDIVISTHDPLDVVRDIYRSSTNDQWVILKQEANKVDLAVQYPQYEVPIMAQSLEQVYKDRQIYPCYSPMSDIIWVWTLFHKKTLAVPNGRMVKYISREIVLEDGPLPEEYFGEIPGYRMAEEDLAGSPWGYSDMADILPICHAITRLTSILLTNNLTFGLQHIVGPNDANINESELGTGLTYLGYDAAKGPNYMPQALNLTKSAPETYTFNQTLTQMAGTLIGINEMDRGNPDLILKGPANAEAMTLMSTQSIQFLSGLNKAYERLAERLGTAIIKMLAKRSVVSRQGRVMSMSGKPYSKQFTGNDLSKIDKVMVKTGNPLSKTTAGRTQIANALIAGGWLKNRQDYIEVMETGNLNPVLESYDQEISLIKDENDAMGDGPIPDAVVFDDHVTHIAEHKVLLASVLARQNPLLIQSVTKHIQSHINFLAGGGQQMNPILASIGNQPTLPPNTPNTITLPKAQPQAQPMAGAPVKPGQGPTAPLPPFNAPRIAPKPIMPQGVAK